MRCKKMQINMKQNSEKKNFLHKADRQNMPVCFITGKIYRKQEYEIKTETDYKIVTVQGLAGLERTDGVD